MPFADLGEAVEQDKALKKREEDVRLSRMMVSDHIADFLPEILKPWVRSFITFLGEHLCERAGMEFIKNPDLTVITLEYDIDMMVWNSALQHFPFIEMLLEFFDGFYLDDDIKAQVVNRHGRMILECTMHPDIPA